MDDTTFQQCFNAAYHHLSYRARSEAELRRYLNKCGFSNEIIGEIITRLKEQGLVDDLAFAQFWRDSRLSSKPRSKRLIARELKEKEVAQETIEQATGDINDEENAYILGCHRIQMLANLDYPDFQRKLSSYLSYRGFSYDIIRQTIGRLWREKQNRI